MHGRTGTYYGCSRNAYPYKGSDGVQVGAFLTTSAAYSAFPAACDTITCS
jgi:hypothetical protein